MSRSATHHERRDVILKVQTTSIAQALEHLSIIHKRCADHDSALFIIYEFKLNHGDQVTIEEKRRILECMEDLSLRCIAFAERSYIERAGTTLHELNSPYCPYSLYQTAVVQYRIWKHRNDPACELRLELIKNLLHEFTKRWRDACEFSKAIHMI